ncbi:MAG: hypothetical protein K2M47_03785 [Clostridiales bacterium]|nr:hypothetical protein [Clostridiales bacterium]
MSTFALRIATPARDVFSGNVDYVSVNTPDGRAGFLRGALPRVAVISEGVIEITVGDEKISIYSTDGILSITADGMTIVTADGYDLAQARDESAMLDDNAGLRYKYAKARIASSLIKMKGKKLPEETF